MLCFAFFVLPILFKSQSWRSSIFDRLCSVKLCFKYFTFLLMDFYRHSAALIFRLLSLLLKSQFWNYLRVSVDYTCKCNAEISLFCFSMCPLNSALLCFSRASCFVQVSVMKVFKSSIDYALRNFVSNLSLFFWWKSPVCTALLWSSRSSYFVQVSMLKHFESFGGLHLPV